MAKNERKKYTKKHSDSAVTVKSSGKGKTEVLAIIIAAIAILLFICLIGKAGLLGDIIKKLFVGIAGYTLSFGIVVLLLILAFCMLRGTKSKVFNAKNVILLFFFSLFLSSFIFTICEKDVCAFKFGDMLKMCWNSKAGGIIDGFVSLLLQHLLARTATYVIIVTGLLVTAILLFGFSIVNIFRFLKNFTSSCISKGKRISQRFKDEKKKKKKEKENEGGKDKPNEEKPQGAEPAPTFTIKKNDNIAKEGDITYDNTTGEIIDIHVQRDKNGEFLVPEIVHGEQLKIKFAENDAEDGADENSDSGKNSDINSGDDDANSNIPQNVYSRPPIELLAMGTNNKSAVEDSVILNNAKKLEKTIKSFGLGARVVNVSIGPNVTRYEMEPDDGVKISQITSLSNDIALKLAAKGFIRIEAPIPGKSTIGIEVPNDVRQTVYLREIIDSDVFKKSKSEITVALGKDVEGNPIVADIAKMPHLLIGGTTGSGKSNLINVILVSLLYKSSPEDVKLVLLDPKMVELSPYDGIPHLALPVITDNKKAAGALAWAVEEMENRYMEFMRVGEHEVDQYNEYALANNLPKMPKIVIVIDEFADLMSTVRDSVEKSMERLTAKARAAGIHLIIATQRPSVDIMIGPIKSNVSARIALSVSSAVDSKIVLGFGSGGAETLLKHGDMLFAPSGINTMKRLQCAYCEKEVKDIVKYLRENNNFTRDENAMAKVESHSNKIDKNGKEIDVVGGGNELQADEIIEQVVEMAIQTKKVSASLIQTRFGIGFQRAARILQWLTDHEIVSIKDGNNPRDVLITSMDEYYELISRQENPDGEDVQGGEDN